VRIIGVIDLKDGLAVHARGGRRDAYSPVREAAGVSIDGDAVELARLYLETFGIRDIYIADLQAIASATPQHDVIRAVSSLGARVHVDAGVTSPEGARQLIRNGAHAIVVGLETLPSFDALEDITVRIPAPTVFSLDLRDGVPMGTAAGTASPEEVARRAFISGAFEIIVLDVARVGSGAGPDVAMMRRIRDAVRVPRLLTAGGIRHLDDLRGLRAAGCDGVLVATALHDGRLTPSDVAVARAL
jgi:phosphoribosylformimino-5-aminoimidazole carboxamide ribotide isomerase